MKNRIKVICNIEKKVEINTIGKDFKSARFYLFKKIVPSYTEIDGGRYDNFTMRIKAVAYGSMAEFIESNTVAGSRVRVEGNIRWNKTLSRGFIPDPEIVVDSIKILDDEDKEIKSYE